MTAEQPRPSMWSGGVIGQDNVDELRRLLDAGADVNELDDPNDGYTLLHCAADNGAVANVQFVLEHGANLLAMNVLGKTPAESAREHGNNEIALLIENYVDTRTNGG